VLGSKGKLLSNFTTIIEQFCTSLENDDSMTEFIKPLQAASKTWLSTSHKIGLDAANNPEEIGAASVDYLMMSGYFNRPLQRGPIV